MSKQLNKKEGDRGIVIKENRKNIVPLVGFSLCALVGGWFGWGLATFFYQLTNVSGGLWNLSFPAVPWPFPTATMVVCALIGGRVGYVVCWRCTKDDDGWTPLHEAAGKGHNKEVAELLIDNGADVNARDEDGDTPLDWADRRNQTATTALLRKHGGKTGEELRTGITPLQQAARDGHKEIAELLIAEGADVNAKNDYGWTPLHWAASRGHKEIVELLIAKGANVNAKNKYGTTPLDMANDRETADLLRKHGGKTGEELKAAGKPTAPVAEAASPEPPTAKAPDLSILDSAEKGNIEAVKQHLAAGANVNAA
jgi:hypothetical protein